MDTGVGDHDVQPAQLGDTAVDRGRDGREIAHVRETRDAAATPAFDFPCGIGQLVGKRRDIQGDHIGALVGEALAVHPPGPLCGAGDHDDLVE